jgi:hypothetical protein
LFQLRRQQDETERTEEDEFLHAGRALPSLKGTAFRHRLAGHSGLLPLRRAAKTERPESAILGSLSHTQGGQTAMVIGVFRSLDANKSRAYTDDEMDRIVNGTLERGALANLLRPAWVALKFIGHELSERGEQGEKRRSVRQERELSKVERRRDSALGKAVESKKGERLLTGAIYTVALEGEGAPPVDGLAHGLSMAVSNAMTPLKTVDHEKIVAELADVRDALSGLPPDRHLDPNLVLTPEEISTYFHPPDAHTSTDGLNTESMAFPLLDAPSWVISARDWHSLPDDVVAVGRVMPGTDQERVVGMRLEDFVGNLFLLGRSRTGKSTWLEGVVAKMAASNSAAFSFDPNTATNLGIIALLAAERPEVLSDPKRAVTLIDWCDPEWPVYLNTLCSEDEKELEIALLITRIVFEAAVGSLASLTRGLGYLECGLRMIANANLALFRDGRDRTGATDDLRYGHLLYIREFFSNRDYRQLLYSSSPHDLVTRMRAYDDKPEKEQEAIADSLLSRVNTLAGNPHYRHTIGSSRTAIRWKDWITSGRTVLHSMDILGPYQDVAKCVLPVLYIQYLREQADYWERAGRPTGDALQKSYVVIDEVHNVAKISTAAEALADALAQASKTGVRQILATQHESQMAVGGKHLAHEIHNNIDHWGSFGLPPKSGGHEARMIDPSEKLLTESDLAGLPRYHAAANLTLLNKRTGKFERTGPFTFESLDLDRPRDGDERWREIVDPALDLVTRRGHESARPKAVAELEAANDFDIHCKQLAALNASRAGVALAPPPSPPSDVVPLEEDAPRRPGHAYLDDDGFDYTEEVSGDWV